MDDKPKPNESQTQKQSLTAPAQKPDTPTAANPNPDYSHQSTDQLLGVLLAEGRPPAAAAALIDELARRCLLVDGAQPAFLAGHASFARALARLLFLALEARLLLDEEFERALRAFVKICLVKSSFRHLASTLSQLFEFLADFLDRPLQEASKLVSDAQKLDAIRLSTRSIRVDSDSDDDEQQRPNVIEAGGLKVSGNASAQHSRRRLMSRDEVRGLGSQRLSIIAIETEDRKEGEESDESDNQREKDEEKEKKTVGSDEEKKSLHQNDAKKSKKNNEKDQELKLKETTDRNNSESDQKAEFKQTDKNLKENIGSQNESLEGSEKSDDKNADEFENQEDFFKHSNIYFDEKTSGSGI